MAIELQDLIERAAAAGADTTPAEAVAAALAEAGLSRTEVDALQNEALEKFGALKAKNDTEGLSQDEVDGFEQLAEVIGGTATEQGRIDTVAAEHQSRLAAIADRVNKVAAPAAAEGDEPAGDEPAGAEVVVDEPTEQAEVVEAPEAVVEAQPEPVAASARKSTRPFDIKSIKGKAPAPLPTNTGGLSMVAAAEVRGFSQGQELHGAKDLAKAAMAKFAAMPRGKAPRQSAPLRAGIATLSVEYPPELTALNEDDTNVVEFAGSQSRLKRDKGTGLVAAGGWGSVSEVSYELAPDLSSESAGLIDVPDVATPRGGIRTPVTPDYSDVFGGDIGLIRTEAEEDVADLEDYVEKSLYRIPTTTWTEKRADVIYTGIEAGILQSQAYPELGARHVELALSIHRHKYNAETIRRMEALSTAWSGAGFGPSATSGILNSVGFLSKHLQYKYRAEPNMLLEWAFPEYVKEIVRADYSLRNGIPLEHVTDQQIDQWFAQRNARVQWVYDWQDAYTGATGTAAFGHSTAPTAYPTQVKALAYPAGTFVRGRGDVINLEAVYDSTNIKKNDFLQLFTEEKILVHKRAYVSYVATLNLGVSGTTGTGLKLDAQGKVAAA